MLLVSKIGQKSDDSVAEVRNFSFWIRSFLNTNSFWIRFRSFWIRFGYATMILNTFWIRSLWDMFWIRYSDTFWIRFGSHVNMFWRLTESFKRYRQANLWGYAPTKLDTHDGYPSWRPHGLFGFSRIVMAVQFLGSNNCCAGTSST